jgi:hypothetical protein
MFAWDEESTEMIMAFHSEPGQVNVTFSQHAAVYALPVERADFVAQMTNITTAFKSRAQVRIVLRGPEIISVEPH